MDIGDGCVRLANGWLLDRTDLEPTPNNSESAAQWDLRIMNKI